ncbi:hypothetical protein ACFLZC_00815 [Patescibacteria group bacterium]
MTTEKEVEMKELNSFQTTIARFGQESQKISNFLLIAGIVCTSTFGLAIVEFGFRWFYVLGTIFSFAFLYIFVIAGDWKKRLPEYRYKKATALAREVLKELKKENGEESTLATALSFIFQKVSSEKDLGLLENWLDDYHQLQLKQDKIFEIQDERRKSITSIDFLTSQNKTLLAKLEDETNY